MSFLPSDTETAPIRVGVFGVRRGRVLGHAAHAAGLEVVAVCDRDEVELARAAHELGAVAYERWDDLLAHEIDAVVLANHFDDHAPYATAALRSGLHVVSETIACATVAEGVNLIRTAEAADRVYALAENYAFKPHVQTLARIFRDGVLGEFQYGEAEYTHGWSDEFLAGFRRPGHWRFEISPLAYTTHALAPIMYVTGTTPVEVTGFLVTTNDAEGAGTRGRGGLIIVRMDDGTTVKLLSGFLQGELEPQASWVRIHGSKGLAENLRRGDSRRVRVRVEEWASLDGGSHDDIVDPEGGLDSTNSQDLRSDAVLMLREFREAVETGTRPFFDVYRGVTASLVGICAIRSLGLGSVPVEVPNLLNEAARVAHEHETRASVYGYEQ